MASYIPQSDSFRVWMQDVIEIKELFADRKYKRCIARCEELQSTAVHSIHKTFLNFYQALSYESLGIAAHRNSSTKLPLLNHAKECFNLALQNLPQLLDEDLAEEAEVSSTPFKSPGCATLDVVESYQHLSPVTDTTLISPSDSTFSSVYHEDRDEALKERAPQRRRSSISSTYSADVPSPSSREVTKDKSRALIKTPPPRKSSKRYLSTPIFTQVPNPFHTVPSDHKARLSLSLSSNHFLLEDLVPSPLFRRISSPPPRTKSLVLYNPVRQFDDVQSNASGSVYRGRPGSETTQDDDDDKFSTMSEGRSLPPLPFNHRPHFEKRGSRHVLIPTRSIGQPKSSRHPRASAIQTMVANFEGKLQNSMSASLPVMPITPITPRFRAISDVFAVKGRPNCEEASTTISMRGDVEEVDGVDQTDEIDDEPRFAQVEIASPPATPVIETTRRSLSTFTPLPTILDDQRQRKLSRVILQTPSQLLQPPRQTPLSTSTSSHYSSSPDSSINLNIHLSAFRTSLDYHLTSITLRIDSATKVQEDHRAKSISRSMSFWSFDVDVPASKEDNKSVHERRKEKIREMFGRGRKASKTSEEADN